MNIARRVTFWSSLGAGLEYYDFIVYGMMAGYLGTLFFPSETTWIAQMKAFAVFAVGYVARPLGGMLFGLFGDTYGRKKSFLTVMLLMAAATFCIGALPTYADVGALAPCLLIFLRLVQGLSFGAELPGAITVISEYVDRKERGICSSFVISSVSVGSLLASLVLYILTAWIDLPQLLQWGWRLPFLMGGMLAVANFFIRRNLEETPAFIELREQRTRISLKEPLQILARKHCPQLFLGFLMTACLSSLVIFALYLPTYLSSYFSYSSQDVYLAMTLSMVWSALSLPMAGYITDRLYRKHLKNQFLVATDFLGGFSINIFIAVALLLSGVAFPLFTLLSIGTLSALLLFLLLYQTILSFLTAAYFILIPALFPTPVRYTGIALSYNVAYALMGCAPIVITLLIQKTGTPLIAPCFLIACALLGAFSCALLKRSKKKIAMGRLS